MMTEPYVKYMRHPHKEEEQKNFRLMEVYGKLQTSK